MQPSYLLETPGLETFTASQQCNIWQIEEIFSLYGSGWDCILKQGNGDFTKLRLNKILAPPFRIAQNITFWSWYTIKSNYDDATFGLDLECSQWFFALEKLIPLSRWLTYKSAAHGYCEVGEDGGRAHPKEEGAVQFHHMEVHNLLHQFLAEVVHWDTCPSWAWGTLTVFNGTHDRILHRADNKEDINLRV